MTLDTEKERFSKLAETNPGEFLWAVYRGGPYALLDSFIASAAERRELGKSWAFDPRNDGLSLIFGLCSADGKPPLRKAVKAYADKTMVQWTKFVEEPNQQGKLVAREIFNPAAVTPAMLSTNILMAVDISKALAKRFGDDQSMNFMSLNSVTEMSDFCLDVLKPLLDRMPAHKSIAEYPDVHF